MIYRAYCRTCYHRCPYSISHIWRGSLAWLDPPRAVGNLPIFIADMVGRATR
ncbi:hypothetical protein L873DRAFT_675555 [Choiromyces venosus 120613-1]|uniref:Uncharacterized protein n=1 Tax=Choiromyces venosus 120613-1 TaxID=1336337 RepID=A0A3N4JWX1_9PEZI|nr:hypothetical protein L873DRAFT_675555 [Choiromyces venosus 120613-1]